MNGVTEKALRNNLIGEAKQSIVDAIAALPEEMP